MTALQWQSARYFATNVSSSADANITSISIILTSRSVLISWKSVAHVHLSPFNKSYTKGGTITKRASPRPLSGGINVGIDVARGIYKLITH